MFVHVRVEQVRTLLERVSRLHCIVAGRIPFPFDLEVDDLADKTMAHYSFDSILLARQVMVGIFRLRLQHNPTSQVVNQGVKLWVESTPI